jgi:plastocyanin
VRRIDKCEKLRAYPRKLLVVVPGTTVWRVNRGDYPHNVNSGEGLLDSRTLYPDDSYWVTFEGRGMVTTTARPR